MPIKSIPEAIAEVPSAEAKPEFTESRYPYTYACDYLRQHRDIVPPEVWTQPDHWSDEHRAGLSYADATRIRETWARLTGTDDLYAAAWLADAYLAQEGITAPNGAREEIIAILSRRPL